MPKLTATRCERKPHLLQRRKGVPRPSQSTQYSDSGRTCRCPRMGQPVRTCLSEHLGARERLKTNKYAKKRGGPTQVKNRQIWKTGRRREDRRGGKKPPLLPRTCPTLNREKKRPSPIQEHTEVGRRE
ncbi:hypothetical protein Hamer_G025496 [Homarus americanus]|uniref:Uncharacterized protein n=1 Tax=Homarus americanus TaxID=6706 RepID=A0A8J5TN82_HOMAM|nr:hypothetical protein Hamer_G025496 [Homarus americanus]